MKKKTVATIWCEGCSGCHMSFLDMDEKLLDLIKKGMTFSASPLTDLKIPPHGTDIGIIEGSVATDTQEEEVKMMRERCKIIVAIGNCAVFGGIPTMRNKYKVSEILSRAYENAETNYNSHIPSAEDISKLLEKVKPVDKVIKVDYYIPGCPPKPEAIYETLLKIIEGEKPELKGKLLSYD
ncbi:MAG: NADP oxidoreductase [Candidatus Calescibacterium sp.]|nr:NADP oxidoreductase [Candidatus Calescibacterium sp.]MCX7971617.1 NADP oxidoreductase [bacterium]MDW8195825.1 NADP oxidoreductase [Candidatus Calescibacterium sp.]